MAFLVKVDKAIQRVHSLLSDFLLLLGSYFETSHWRQRIVDEPRINTLTTKAIEKDTRYFKHAVNMSL